MKTGPKRNAVIKTLRDYSKHRSFSGGSVVKNLPAMQEIRVPLLGQEDPLGGGHGNPLQYSWLENPTDRGAWWATVHGVIECDVTEQLNTTTKAWEGSTSRTARPEALRGPHHHLSQSPHEAMWLSTLDSPSLPCFLLLCGCFPLAPGVGLPPPPQVVAVVCLVYCCTLGTQHALTLSRHAESPNPHPCLWLRSQNPVYWAELQIPSDRTILCSVQTNLLSTTKQTPCFLCSWDRTSRGKEESGISVAHFQDPSSEDPLHLWPLLQAESHKQRWLATWSLGLSSLSGCPI